MSAQRRPAAGGRAREDARLTDALHADALHADALHADALHAGARDAKSDDARLGEIVGRMSSADYDAALLALAGAIEGAALDPEARDAARDAARGVQRDAADGSWWRRLLAIVRRAARRLTGSNGRRPR